MSKNLLKLALKCAHKEWTYSKRKIIGVHMVYEVSTDSDIVYFWNSSNDYALNVPRVLREISELIADGILSGSFHDDFKEVMFEVEEK